MRLLVVMDVDSTMIEQEVIELLAAKMGLLDQVKLLTDKAMAGEIDFRKALDMRVQLLAGLDSQVFQELQTQILVTDGVTELIEAVHDAGGVIGAISGGFSQVLAPLASKLGLDCYLANELEVSAGVLTGKVSGEIVDASMKAKTLISWAERFGIELSQTVAIGDGANDIQMLQAAGFAVAFRPKDILREHADFVIEGDSLKPLIAELGLGSG
ncbi:MAG: phosphoserine phosphatase SerB [Actinobacteria bacterium]|uniref:phosphoserine phosphatase n=1 Tax=freshwater metagenome TaxID=449393 RepID=A0A6J6CSQ3_9ZZZZ|nr:phosphoserine phosphatase SerB [Actinomycetota bacterium]